MGSLMCYFFCYIRFFQNIILRGGCGRPSRKSYNITDRYVVESCKFRVLDGTLH